MIEDIILWLKKTFKQQTCIHKYKDIHRKDTGGSVVICEKCNKIQ